jgi:hypothetical protein
LIKSDSAISLYRTPEAKPESKLVDLPSGTIVSLGKEEEGFTQIAEPVAGWILNSDIATIDVGT